MIDNGIAARRGRCGVLPDRPRPQRHRAWWRQHCPGPAHIRPECRHPHAPEPKWRVDGTKNLPSNHGGWARRGPGGSSGCCRRRSDAASSGALRRRAVAVAATVAQGRFHPLPLSSLQHQRVARGAARGTLPPRSWTGRRCVARPVGLFGRRSCCRQRLRHRGDNGGRCALDHQQGSREWLLQQRPHLPRQQQPLPA